MTTEAFDGSELDFWLGAWDVTWDGGHGSNRISRTLRDRVILEEFDEADDSGGAEALHGRSWSVFDPDRHTWRQTWVDDQGSYLELLGARVDGWFRRRESAALPNGRGERRLQPVLGTTACPHG